MPEKIAPKCSCEEINPGSLEMRIELVPPSTIDVVAKIIQQHNEIIEANRDILNVLLTVFITAEKEST